MAVLPAGAGIRGYPTRRARVRAAKSARGRGYGHQNPLVGVSTGTKIRSLVANVQQFSPADISAARKKCKAH
jgi:hypothetical protein